MFLIFTRALLLYAAVLIIMRVMGKRQIGQMQPFELVLTLMIADLASTPMEDPGIPLLYGLVPVLTLFFAHEALTLLVLKSERMRAVICGRPSILVQNGKIDQREIRRQRVDINDLLEQFRVSGVPNVEDVSVAILESSGQVSVFPVGAKRGSIPEDFALNPQNDQIPFTVILDGRINRDNLRKARLTEGDLQKLLEKQKIASYKDVFLATVDARKNLRVQRREA